MHGRSRSGGGATQLYLDKHFDEPIVRQLSVAEEYAVMGKPCRLDTSEEGSDEKLRLLGKVRMATSKSLG